MPPKLTPVESYVSPVHARAEIDQPVLHTALIERVGLLAIMRSEQSRHIQFASGAVGYSDVQIHMAGKLAGRVSGHISLTLPAEQGNVLIIPRQALIDTHREIMPAGSQISFGGDHLLPGIMKLLSGRAVHGVRYDACISLLDDPVKQVEEVTYATAGSQDLTTLHIPYPETPLR